MRCGAVLCWSFPGDHRLSPYVGYFLRQAGLFFFGFGQSKARLLLFGGNRRLNEFVARNDRTSAKEGRMDGSIVTYGPQIKYRILMTWSQKEVSGTHKETQSRILVRVATTTRVMQDDRPWWKRVEVTNIACSHLNNNKKT